MSTALESVRRPLQATLQRAEEQGGHWFESLLIAGLKAMLGESRHDAVQQRAEQGLHALLSKGFEALPDEARDLQRQTERTLQAILRDAIDAMFAETTRATALQHGEAAIREVLHGDFGKALADVRELFAALLQALVDVLRRQWQRVLRLLLRVIMVVLESTLTSSEEEKEAEGSPERQKAGAGSTR